MSKTTIAIIVYILGLAFGALGLDLWGAKTGPISIIGMVWTVIFLIALFYSEKRDNH